MINPNLEISCDRLTGFLLSNGPTVTQMENKMTECDLVYRKGMTSSDVENVVTHAIMQNGSRKEANELDVSFYLTKVLKLK